MPAMTMGARSVLPSSSTDKSTASRSRSGSDWLHQMHLLEQRGAAAEGDLVGGA